MTDPDCDHHHSLGVEEPSVYDGILYWICCECGFAQPRLTEGRRGAQAKLLADTHNRGR